MRKKLLFFILFVLMITGIAVGIHDYFHWQVMLTTETFTESTEKIWNPNRGFYHIYGFLISDEPADMSEQLDRQMQKDTDHAHGRCCPNNTASISVKILTSRISDQNWK